MTTPIVVPTDAALARLRARLDAGVLLTVGEARLILAALDYWRGQAELLEEVETAASRSQAARDEIAAHRSEHTLTPQRLYELILEDTRATASLRAALAQVAPKEESDATV